MDSPPETPRNGRNSGWARFGQDDHPPEVSLNDDVEPPRENQSENPTPIRIGRFLTIEDVLKANQRMMRALVEGRISADEVSAFVKLANVVIQARKTQAITGSADGQAEADLSRIAKNPDIETVRPQFLSVNDFRAMSEEERDILAASLINRMRSRS